MKSSKLFLASLFSVSFILLTFCEVNSELEEECEKTKWTEVKEPTIAVYVSQPNNFCDYTHRVDNAYQVNVVGSIQKFYCNNTPSGRFEFSNHYSPKTFFEPVRLGQAYQFKFQHDEDRLELKCKFKAYFNDGAAFESEDLRFTFYYKDILYNINRLEYYILEITKQNLSWHTSI